MKRFTEHTRALSLAALAVAAAGLVSTGCTVTGTQSDGAHSDGTQAQERATLDESADQTLNRLYKAAPEARKLVQRSKGALIFPSVTRGAFIVGFEHGDGVLQINGHDSGYYTTTGGSVGWQAGVQSRAMVLLFMSDQALKRFRNSNGWTVGADATVAIANVGANGAIDTNTGHSDVVGFVLTNKGVMAGVSLDGTKIQKKGS